MDKLNNERWDQLIWEAQIYNTKQEMQVELKVTAKWEED